MLRVLLLLEDYGEMVFLQILLQKLGFDVGTIKNPKALTDSLFKMRPDVVVLTARGKRVNGTELSGLVKKASIKAQVILLAQAALRERIGNNELQNVEAILESPVNPHEFIETISRLGHLDANVLLEKYKRMKPQITETASQEVSRIRTAGDLESTPETLEVRSHDSRYAKFLKLDAPPPAKSFNKRAVTEKVKEFRNEPADPDLDQERQAFVKAMFKKKA